MACAPRASCDQASSELALATCLEHRLRGAGQAIDELTRQVHGLAVPVDAGLEGDQLARIARGVLSVCRALHEGVTAIDNGPEPAHDTLEGVRRGGLEGVSRRDGQLG